MRFEIRRDVLRLALPTFAEQSFFLLMGVVNTIMAGRIGREAGAATGAVDALNVIFINLLNALSVGATVVVAQYIGQGNTRMANETVRQALVTNALIATLIAFLMWLFGDHILHLLYGKTEPAVMAAMQVYLSITLLSYPLMSITQVVWGCLRGAGDTKTPMKVNIVMNILNVILGYVFIYGIQLQNSHFNLAIPGWGVKGAAISISLARGIGALMALWVLWRGVSIIRLTTLRHFRFKRDILRAIFGISIPASSESFIFNIGKIITQVFIAGMGTAALAANTFASAINNYMNLPGAALQITATTLIGQNMGRGDTDEADKLFRHFFRFGNLCMITMGLIFISLAPWVAALFTPDREIIELTTLVIRINAIFMLVWAGSFVLPSGLKGAGDAKYTMWVAIGSMWFLRIALGYLLGVVLGFGLIGVWIGMFADWTLRATLFYRRVRSGKWKTMEVLGR